MSIWCEYDVILVLVLILYRIFYFFYLWREQASKEMFNSTYNKVMILHCTALHCTALHCTALHCTALHCTALHCTALHCTALHCTALHCIVLNLGGANADFLRASTIKHLMSQKTSSKPPCCVISCLTAFQNYPIFWHTFFG